MKYSPLSSALTAVAMTLALPAMAQFQKPEDAIKYRQSALFVMGQHFGRVGAMANGRIPFDANVMVENTAVIEDLAKLPWVAFSTGTDKGATKAKPEVWSEQARFKEHADKLQTVAARLANVAKTDNLDQIKVAFGATASTCKACHDAFRSQ